MEYYHYIVQEKRQGSQGILQDFMAIPHRKVGAILPEVI